MRRGFYSDRVCGSGIVSHPVTPLIPRRQSLIRSSLSFGPSKFRFRVPFISTVSPKLTSLISFGKGCIGSISNKWSSLDLLNEFVSIKRHQSFLLELRSLRYRVGLGDLLFYVERVGHVFRVSFFIGLHLLLFMSHLVLFLLGEEEEWGRCVPNQLRNYSYLTLIIALRWHINDVY